MNSLFLQFKYQSMQENSELSMQNVDSGVWLKEKKGEERRANAFIRKTVENYDYQILQIFFGYFVPSELENTPEEKKMQQLKIHFFLSFFQMKAFLLLACLNCKFSKIRWCNSSVALAWNLE